MKKIVYLLLILFSFSSCERAFFDEDLESEDPFEVYDYLWDQVNENYSYFDVKNIDWNDVNSRYRSRVYNGMTKDSLFNVCAGILRELRDDHTNLQSSFNVGYFGVKYLGPDNYDERIVEDNYIGQQHFITGPFQHNWIANQQIGYIRFAAFTGTTNETNLDYIFNKYSGARGLIIDLRENGGGSVADVFNILGRLIDVNTVVYKSRIKNGKGRNDFSDFENAVAEPADGPRFTGRPVMVLIDRGTYSAGSFTSLSTKALSNVKLVGDTTGGGLGLPNGGHLPNGWFYRFSVSQAVSSAQAALYESGQKAQADAENYEKGVPPDFRVLLDRTDVTKDEVIDFAINQILN